jgi:DtxR family Mn-dependent transcriptional regulator
MAASHRGEPAITEIAATSESEEMYLITIAMAVEGGAAGPVPVPHLADELQVSRVSANEMVKKLAGRGLVEYIPYKGAELSATGERIARTILRRRRLWSVFLSDRLGLSPQTADQVACEFEHITPADVADRLSEFLGDPRLSPQGKPIPSPAEAVPPREPAVALSDVLVGSKVEVIHVAGALADRSFLADQGIRPGGELTVLAIGEGGSFLLDTPPGRVHLAREVAQLVEVALRS